MELLPLVASPRPLVPGTRIGLRTALAGLRPGDRVAVLAGDLGVATPGDRDPVGTVARIAAVRSAAGDACYLDAAGERLARIGPPRHDGLVPAHPVEPPESGVPGELIDRVQRMLHTYMAVRVEWGEPGDVTLHLSRDPIAASHEVASQLRISWPEVQELLEAGTARERLERALLVLRREVGLLRSALGGKGTT